MNSETARNDLEKRLRTAYAAETPSIKLPRFKLPRSIEFAQDGATLRMHLRSDRDQDNMQDDASAFEGWALALKRWLKVDAVEMRWDPAPQDDKPQSHYQRFLYRAQKFQSVFGDWFSIFPKNTTEFSKLKTGKPGEKYWLNVESAPRRTTETQASKSLPDAMKKEHDLECYIAAHPDGLQKLLHTGILKRQCPVGVFKNDVSAAPENAVFPRHHSAIDLWSVNEATEKLFLFELKKPGNISIGILSEMFFYSFIMRDVQKGNFTFEVEKNTDDKKAIADTESIVTFILAPDWHPLIDEGLLQLANTAFKKKEGRIRFGAIKIGQTEPFFRLEIPADDQQTAIVRPDHGQTVKSE